MDIAIKIDPKERRKRAESFFVEGYNCCQSVLLAYCDIFPLDETMLKTIGSGLGGGVGRMREVCGSVTAMAIAAGFLSPATDASDHQAKTDNYALVQQLAGRFKEQTGSIVCRELLDIRAKRESPEPSERTPEYYKTRPCAAMVGLSAQIIAEYLLSKQK